MDNFLSFWGMLFPQKVKVVYFDTVERHFRQSVPLQDDFDLFLMVYAF